MTVKNNTARSNALHSSNRISVEEITTGVLGIYIFIYSHAQSASRQYNNQTVLAGLLEHYSVSVPPLTNNIYRSAVPAPNYLETGRRIPAPLQPCL